MRYLFFLLFITAIFSSCHTQKKMADSRKILAVIKTRQHEDNKRLAIVDSIVNAKLEQGKIDKNIRSLIDKLLNKIKHSIDSSETEIASLESVLKDRKQFKSKYKSSIMELLASLKKRTEFTPEKSSLYRLLEDGLNIADYKLFDLAAFFGPGIHIIPDDKKEIVVQSFAPIIDSLIIFSNKYNQIPCTATLIVLGYADGTGFAYDAALLDTLKTLIGKADPSKEELNQKLSELRAKELSNEFAKMFAQKAPALINLSKLRINYINQGKGEEYPLPYIKDYKIEDDRRRIVLCYWAVLPD